MAPERLYGMDHEHYAWSPMPSRSTLKWPNDARLALCVIVNLEHLEWEPPADSYQSPNVYSHLAMQRPLVEFWTISHREYGHRIGIFRVLDVLEKHGITPTVAMDAKTATHYPYLVKHCQARGAEIIAHGVAVTQMVTSNMNEDEERGYIARSVEALRRATGSVPEGWFGPEYGESTRTPGLLAEAGFRYVCDWANDEQPYRFDTPTGELYSLPVMIELDDVFALRDRRFPVDDYAGQLKEGFDVMYRDGAATGRLLVLNLHPWLIGQPCRIGFLDEALGHMMRRRKVWKATGSEIIDWYRETAVRAA